MLRATCRTFATCELMEHTARGRCQSITRAQGLQPSFRCVSVRERAILTASRKQAKHEVI